jgi:hypothetical protein
MRTKVLINLKIETVYTISIVPIDNIPRFRYN